MVFFSLEKRKLAPLPSNGFFVFYTILNFWICFFIRSLLCQNPSLCHVDSRHFPSSKKNYIRSFDIMERKRRNRKVFWDLKWNKNLTNVETRSPWTLDWNLAISSSPSLIPMHLSWCSGTDPLIFMFRPNFLLSRT